MNQREPSGIAAKMGVPELALLKSGGSDMMTATNVLDVVTCH